MKKRSITSSFVLTMALPAVALLLLLANTLTFGILYAIKGEMLFLILLIAIDALLLGAFVVLLILLTKYVRVVYYDGFYRVSRENMSQLSQGKMAFSHYPDDHIEEMSELNAYVDRIGEKMSVSILYSKNVDYHALNLEILDEETHLVEEAKLRSYLPDLIQASGAFTIGLLDLHYEIGKEKLTEEEKQRLLRLANEAFSFIPSRLFAFEEDGKSMLCYLPGIDSMRIVSEKITSYVSDLSVSKTMSDGMKFFPVKAAMVCYPNSSVTDIEDDLRYAKRQSAPITIFLPDRKKSSTKTLNFIEHQNTVAFFNKVLLPIRHLDGVNVEADRATLQEVYSAVGSYIGAEIMGLTLLEDTTNTHYAFFDDGKGLEEMLHADFLSLITAIIDEDNSFYFSTRASCSEVLARHTDTMGINAGFLYALYNGKKCIGVLYYGRRKGDMVFDSYTKEALIRMGDCFTDYFFLAEKEARARTFQRQSEHILGISNYSVYKVDDTSLHLTYVSPNLRALFPNAEVGEKCHKALYGLDRMCPHCPIREYAKMEGEAETKLRGKVKNVEIETSLTLNDTKSHERTLLVERIKEGAIHSDPYDKNWLAYSFATLVGQLENAYLVHSRGYLLLVSLDNIDTFITSQGSEGACFSVRCFIQEIKKALDTQDVYAYNPSCIAVLLPRTGHVEIIDVCEAIYDISKKHYLDDGSDDSFRLTYLPLGYPRGYTSANDFLSHSEEFYRNGDYKRNSDFIFFHDHSISRSASKKDHMLAVIDEVFGTRTASCVYLQPMVLASDKKIFGAEVLLRVEDTQRHNFFRADELSRIAEQNGRISLITESLLNFVNGLYQEHGNSVFAINNFRRIAINVDAAFLSDTELSKKVTALYQEQHLGKDFLSFEVPEDLIGDNFENEGNSFSVSGAVLVCDRYTGKYVSMQKLKKYGFREVKLPRELVNGIELDAKKLALVEDIVATAKSLDMKVAVVGVENEAQYLALKNLDETMLLQGYYFYKPLSRADLITAVVSHDR